MSADFYQFEPAGGLVVRELRAAGVSLIVAVFDTGKWTVRTPYSGDGKIHRFNGRNRNCRVRGYLCAGGLERASLMTPKRPRDPDQPAIRHRANPPPPKKTKRRTTATTKAQPRRR
jgi:hypothetical protein